MDIYGSAPSGLLTRVASPLAARARRRRYRLFVEAAGVGPRDRVLDIGCGSAGLAALDGGAHPVTGVDALDQPGYPGEFVRADALDMPFADREFDVAYCNSLIEHVAPARRARLSSEIRRVAERYFVQTPNRWFPVEPHVLLPLFQFLPHGLRRRLWRFGASGEEFHDIHLLGRRELARLFPDAVILRERVGPLTKSIMAVGPRERLP